MRFARTALLGCVFLLAAPAWAGPRATADSASTERIELKLTGADGRPARGGVVVSWPDGPSVKGRAKGGRAILPLPRADAFFDEHLHPAPPDVYAVQVLVKGRHGGTVELRGDGDPAFDALHAAVASLHAGRLAEHRAGVAARQGEELVALRRVATDLGARLELLESPITEPPWAGADRDQLAERAAVCPSLKRDREPFVDRLGALAPAWAGPVDGMPPGLDTPEAALARLDAAAGRCLRLLLRHGEAETRAATAAALAEQRPAWEKSRRAVAARDALADIANLLVEMAGMQLLTDYERAVAEWQYRATVALRMSTAAGPQRPPPEQVEAAEEAAARAEERVRALNAGLSLALSGRSGQLNDEVKSAARRLKPVDRATREQLVAAYGDGQVPGGWIIEQLVTDALR